MQLRDKFGKYSVKGMEMTTGRKVWGSALLAIIMFGGGASIREATKPTVISFQKAEAEEIKQEVKEFEGVTIEELEAKLDALVWQEESGSHVMKEGEIFQTFDPPAGEKWWAICTKIGGKVNQECYSNGPRQSKIPTIQGKWKELYGVSISEKDARDVAEDNDKSRRFFLDCSVKIEGCAMLWTGFRKNKVKGQIYIDLIREKKGITI
jgi:hypothetical protein